MREKNIAEFNQDILRNKGYLYAVTDRPSCRMSNDRMTRAIRQIGDFRGKRVADVGCGDGTYTMQLLKMGAEHVDGLDAAEDAVAIARQRAAGKPAIQFKTQDLYTMACLGRRYDVVVLRGVLHHLYDGEKAVSQVAAIAGDIVVVEANGYNLFLKMIEKTSLYHIRHEEKSYTPRFWRRLFRGYGGDVVAARYIGLVPMFCPYWIARLLKGLEPLIERAPILRQLFCGQYVFRVKVSHPCS